SSMLTTIDEANLFDIRAIWSLFRRPAWSLFRRPAWSLFRRPANPADPAARRARSPRRHTLAGGAIGRRAISRRGNQWRVVAGSLAGAAGASSTVTAGRIRASGRGSHQL